MDNYENNNENIQSTSTESTSQTQAPTYRCDPNNNSYSYTNANQGNNPNMGANPNNGNYSYNYSYADASGVKKEQKKKKENGKTPFGVILGRAAAIAAVCGLLGGGTFAGVNWTINRLTGSGIQVGSTAENNNQATIGSQIGEETITPDKTGPVISTTRDPLISSGSTKIVASDVSGIVEQCLPSIVSVTNMSVVEYHNFWGQKMSQNQQSAGSGIIVSQDDEHLYIATNDHVVSGANSLTVQFCDDTVVPAEVRGTSENNDLAVIMIKLKDISEETLEKIRVAVINDKDNVKVGEAAIAIGNALGYGQSVTVGVISALDREVTVTDQSTGKEYSNHLMQTDAAINFGNSGGALLNSNGEVIGINSVKFSGSAEAMGFAIPMTKAAPIINELITREEVPVEKVGYLGISGVAVSSTVAQNYGMPEGVCITKLYPGSSAAEYGLMKGDIITEFENQKVTSMENLSEMVKYHAVGTSVKVGFYRANNGEYVFSEVEVVLGEKPQ